MPLYALSISIGMPCGSMDLLRSDQARERKRFKGGKIVDCWNPFNERRAGVKIVGILYLMSGERAKIVGILYLLSGERAWRLMESFI